MKSIRSIVLAAIMLPAATALSGATVKPAALFSDHMVMQQGASDPVWGWADPSEKVTVSIGGQTVSTVTGSDGAWKVAVTGLKPGGPETMTIAGSSNRLTIIDVLVGEVWLASGQSNMDFTVSNANKTFAGVQDMDKEIAAANWPEIRMFTVDLKLADEPQKDVTGHWAVCSPATVGDMSAVAYFFARDLYQDRHVPMGVIDSTWGASTAQCWTSRDALLAEPLLKPLVDQYESVVAAYDPQKAQTDYQAKLAAWQRTPLPLPRQDSTRRVSPRNRAIRTPTSTIPIYSITA